MAREVLLKLSANPIVRVLAVVIAIAMSIRLVVALLAPVWAYLGVVFVCLLVCRAISWWERRW